ncbi:MAG: nitroreductase family protein [Oscillospiraceae bacterium]|nr:nitroreductase family protein [Oscillospiraceae bacterium]
MDFLKLATDRYSVRKFAHKPLEKDVIDKILEAGHIAPTGCNYQPQRILVINNKETLEKLKECTKCLFDAPCAMLVCYNKDECWTRPYDGSQSGIVDASIVTTHMMLQAWELGVGSTWVMHFNPFKMREVFAIPENVEPVALLVMGYPAPDAVPNERHTVYRPMEETVFYNDF